MALYVIVIPLFLWVVSICCRMPPKKRWATPNLGPNAAKRRKAPDSPVQSSSEVHRITREVTARVVDSLPKLIQVSVSKALQEGLGVQHQPVSVSQVWVCQELLSYPILRYHPLSSTRSLSSARSSAISESRIPASITSTSDFGQHSVGISPSITPLPQSSATHSVAAMFQAVTRPISALKQSSGKMTLLILDY